MNWCDPYAADPLSVEELRSLGVFWLKVVAELTGWDLANIRAQMNLRTSTASGADKWWQKPWAR